MIWCTLFLFYLLCLVIIFWTFLCMTVQALLKISSKLNNKHWKTLNQSSCSRPGDFNVTFGDNIYSNVNCDCSFNNNSVCHVTHMYDPILTFLIFSVNLLKHYRERIINKIYFRQQIEIIILKRLYTLIEYVMLKYYLA